MLSRPSFSAGRVVSPVAAAFLALLLVLEHGACAAAVRDEGTTIPECCRPKGAEAPRVHVVTFRTDNCEACRILEPVVTAAADEFTSAPVLFLTLDFTTPRQAKQSEYLARSLALDEMWKHFQRQSGFVVVVDGETRRPLAKITHFDSPEVLKEAVRKVLDR